MIPWTVGRQAPMSTLFQSLLKFMPTESVMLSNHLILCLPLLLLPSSSPALESFLMSWLFASGGQSIGASASSHMFQWIFKNDFLYNRLVWSPSSSRNSQVSSQHYNLKASILRCPALFMVQLSYLYMTTEKTTALTKWTFATKVMSLLFNMFSSL